MKNWLSDVRPKLKLISVTSGVLKYREQNAIYEQISRFADDMIQKISDQVKDLVDLPNLAGSPADEVRLRTIEEYERNNLSDPKSFTTWIKGVLRATLQWLKLHLDEAPLELYVTEPYSNWHQTLERFSAWVSNTVTGADFTDHTKNS